MDREGRILMNPKAAYRFFINLLFPLLLWMYRVCKPVFIPVVTRFPRIHRFAHHVKEAARSLLQPGYMPRPGEEQAAHSAALHPELEPPSPVYGPAECPVPEWLLKEWKAMHELEPRLFPDVDTLNRLVCYKVPASGIARPYLKICKKWDRTRTHVFLVPWLVTGGSDLLTLNYVRALSTHIDPGRILVLATENRKSPWKDRLPKGAAFLDFGRDCADLSPDQQETLLVRLFLQNAPSVIHNINSAMGYRLFQKYGHALEDASRLYAASFCGDRSVEGRKVGYPFRELNDCFDRLTAVLTDNQAHIDELVHLFGMEREKFHCHYQPAPSGVTPKSPDTFRVGSAAGKSPAVRPLNVLWAGRLDRQKRPDLLIRIAKAAAGLPVRFHAFGSSVLEGDIYTPEFARQENLQYHGSFDGLTSLNADCFDLFLNTSEWDGLPNILLEAMSMGLPVISSDAGGISEVAIHGESGLLISPFDDVDAYVAALQRALDAPDEFIRFAENAARKLKVQHSFDAFARAVATVPGYLNETAGADPDIDGNIGSDNTAADFLDTGGID